MLAGQVIVQTGWPAVECSVRKTATRHATQKRFRIKLGRIPSSLPPEPETIEPLRFILTQAGGRRSEQACASQTPTEWGPAPVQGLRPPNRKPESRNAPNAPALRVTAKWAARVTLPPSKSTVQTEPLLDPVSQRAPDGVGVDHEPDNANEDQCAGPRSHAPAHPVETATPRLAQRHQRVEEENERRGRPEHPGGLDWPACIGPRK